MGFKCRLRLCKSSEKTVTVRKIGSLCLPERGGTCESAVCGTGSGELANPRIGAFIYFSWVGTLFRNVNVVSALGVVLQSGFDISSCFYFQIISFSIKKMLKQVLLVLALSIYQLNAEEGAARLLLAKQVNITMRTILKQFGFKLRLGWPLNYGCIEFIMGIRISISKNKHPFILIENGGSVLVNDFWTPPLGPPPILTILYMT